MSKGLSKEEIMEILAAVMQAKEEAGQKVQSATIMMEDEVIHVDNTQEDKELPN
jgi:hypothetical protein